MFTRRLSSAAAIVGLVAALAGGVLGCGRHAALLLGPNQPPELEIVSAGAAGGVGGVHVRWAARDPDGRVESYRWTLSPLESSWLQRGVVKTSASDCLLPRADARVEWRGGRSVRQPDLFTVWAVDDRGGESRPARLALFANNVAPTVLIQHPQPFSLITTTTGPNLCIDWQGIDPDGVFTQAPVKYRFIVLSMGDPTNQIYLSSPDSLRRRGVATGWADWDSCGGDTTFRSYTGLTQGQSYIFAVTGVDEAGDYDPIFDFNKNMLSFNVGFPETLGPLLTVAGPALLYHFTYGGMFLDPQSWIHMEVGPTQPLEFSVSALSGPGQTVSGYRWVLDPVDYRNETPRSGPTDLQHWSAWDLEGGAISLPPFADVGVKRREHLLYVEARRGFGGCNPPSEDFVSLGIVHLVVVHPTRTHELLVVDDTRFEADRYSAGCPLTYTTTWPSAAELDTFLYARGNVTWRCTKNPTSGVLSKPGLFAGYSFDTLGTSAPLTGAIGSTYPSANHTVPLSVLADYRHVIWLTDLNAALRTNSPDVGAASGTVLRFTSAADRISVLASYVGMGGKVWLAGGGSAFASLINFNRSNNDFSGTTVFSSSLDELGPGRLMYERAHWRSTIGVTKSAVQFSRSPRAEEIAANPWRHWSVPLGDTLRAPDYLHLPPLMRARTAGTDPIPPTRLPSQGGSFYPTSFACEYLRDINVVMEDIDPDPAVHTEASVLDTLMQATGGVLSPSPAPAMTYYHGNECQPFVFSGFAPWDFARADCMQLVDFVLQDVWGLTRANIDRGAVAPQTSRARPARLVTPAQRSVAARTAFRPRP